MAVVGLALSAEAPSAAKPVPLPTLSQLEADIAASTHIRTMPNLLKTIPPITSETGMDERPWPNRTACIKENDPTLPANPVTSCSYGDLQAHRTILLFGDSHAAMFAPTLNVVGELLHWRVVELSQVGCWPWLDPKNVNAQGESMAACQQWRKNVIAYANRSHPAVAMPIGIAGDYGRNTWPTETQLAKEMTSLFAALKPSHSKLVLIGLSPEMRPENVSECLVSVSNPQQCAKSVKAATHPTFPGAIAMAAKSYHLKVINVFPLFCSTKSCPAIVKGSGGTRIVYYDDQHMLRWYAAWIGHAMAQLIGPSL